MQPFEDESVETACAHPRATEPDNNQEAKGSNENTSNNIGQGANQEYISELRLKGAEVENEDCLLKTFSMAKTKIRYRGAWGMGDPLHLHKEGVSEHQ